MNGNLFTKMTRPVLKTMLPSLLAAVCLTNTTAMAQNARPEKYPYGGKQFTDYVRESYRIGKSGSADTFYKWWNGLVRDNGSLFPGSPDADMKTRMAAEKHRLAMITDPSEKAAEEIKIAAQLHKAVKKVIPKFSLERGYEFRYARKTGERQCLLQSVLLAGMMQQMGMDAGAYMVWKSENGGESNNGHVVTVLKMPDKNDILVDCSEPHAFAKQQGLFVWDTGQKRYRYVVPTYGDGDKPIITGYQILGSQQSLSNKTVRPLDVKFVASQFDYYRGEHTKGGLLDGPKTVQGLAAEAHYLERSIKESPQNPLSMYMLGRVYLKQGKLAAAQKYLTRSHALYAKAGRIPQGSTDALTELRIAMQKSKGKVRTASAN